jgi:prophage antirepressor-like protein
MNNEIKIFEHEQFGAVRMLMKDGQPWFVGKDIANILGYADLNKAIAMHVDDEDKKLNDKRRRVLVSVVQP